jgi:hypothetical protein
MTNSGQIWLTGMAGQLQVTDTFDNTAAKEILVLYYVVVLS